MNICNFCGNGFYSPSPMVEVEEKGVFVPSKLKVCPACAEDEDEFYKREMNK